jgi:hypothetical protein
VCNQGKKSILPNPEIVVHEEKNISSNLACFEKKLYSRRSEEPNKGFKNMYQPGRHGLINPAQVETGGSRLVRMHCCGIGTGIGPALGEVASDSDAINKSWYTHLPWTMEK